MDSIPFLEPRLVGTRFDDHTIPLEFLKDFAALEEMIAEVAKLEFLKDHPDRQRSPRGFTAGVSLKLAGVDDGSAKPLIVLAITAATLFPMDNQQLYYERARDAVVGAIQAAEAQTSITEHIPERTLGYFDRMGRSLRDGEAMEFSTPDSDVPARLTRETRRALVLASSKLKEITEETLVRGTVPEADQDDMTFEIQLCTGKKVPAPISLEHFDTIIEAFNGYGDGVRVQLEGIGRLNRNGALLRLDSIEEVTILEALDIPARLEELHLLKAGWLEGEGESLSAEGLNWLSEAFGRRFSDELPLPYLYPTAEGGVQAEWTLGQFEVSLEIDLEEHAGRWHALDVATNDESARDLDLDADDDWEWIDGQIRDKGSNE